MGMGFNIFEHCNFRNGRDLFKDFAEAGFFDDDDDFEFFKGGLFNDDDDDDDDFFRQGFNGFGQGQDFGQNCGKSISRQSTMKNGRRVTLVTTKVINPNGTTTISKTEEIDDGHGNVTLKKLGPGS